MPKAVTLTVCETCGYDPEHPDAPRPGAAMADLFEADVQPRITVQRTRCLMSCSRPCAVALQAPESYGYVVCDLPVDAHSVDAVYAFASAYAASTDGTVDWADWPERIKGRFAARIPWLSQHASPTVED